MNIFKSKNQFVSNYKIILRVRFRFSSSQKQLKQQSFLTEQIDTLIRLKTMQLTRKHN